MCGRFTQTKTREEVLKQLGEVELPPLFHGRYNVAPTQNVAVFRQSNPTKAQQCIWGFQNPHSGALVINARSETLAERPMFKDLLAANRCLIPADGFYEWKGKQPYYFQTLKQQLFGFAGLWREGRCVIITRAADQNMQGIHHRMPVIIDQTQWNNWLASPGKVTSALTIVSSDVTPQLTSRPVSRRVNKVVNDDAGCLDPGEIQGDLF
ncbi:Putative SOS response-associated peptidase YedK [Pontiella desulfatans]|uniref:Abasic site processing protein n=1 Tax=Pontiella desulfatans TaxID=2750659 RepID=A0A6C2U606_PONDE|nr:SOS response-associated peptidase [Pontiella desulfatans]VGO15512.1 Putative SOS response-associated peptidase YedK [Pontiella desulfatans]